MAGETLLVISGHGVQPYSARGLQQTLTPIATAVPPRTVNGTLVNLVPSGFLKLKTTLSCSDVSAPALAALWPGVTVTIDCAAEIVYLTAIGNPLSSRTVIASRIEGAYTFARLRLSMMVVTPWQHTFDEYAAAHEWSIELEEI